MTRARVLGTLLALVLLACAAVIYLDQRGALVGTATSTSSGSVGTTTAPDPSTSSSGDGYGDLK